MLMKQEAKRGRYLDNQKYFGNTLYIKLHMFQIQIQIYSP